MVRLKLPASLWKQTRRTQVDNDVDMHDVDVQRPEETSQTNHQNVQNESTGGVSRFTAGDEGARCCSDLCGNAHAKGGDFYKIDPGCRVGGKNWNNYMGKVLCVKCYDRYAEAGTLEPEPSNDTPKNDVKAKRCWYAHCPKPEGGDKYYNIRANMTLLGDDQDWSDAVGQLLCTACYSQYRCKGTLERKCRPHSMNQEFGAGTTVNKRKRDDHGNDGSSNDDAEERTNNAKDNQQGTAISFCILLEQCVHACMQENTCIHV
jgi:hypothetical protein